MFFFVHRHQFSIKWPQMSIDTNSALIVQNTSNSSRVLAENTDWGSSQSLGWRRRWRRCNLFATLFATAALTTIVARTHLQQHIDKREIVDAKCFFGLKPSLNGTKSLMRLLHFCRPYTIFCLLLFLWEYFQRWNLRSIAGNFVITSCIL